MYEFHQVSCFDISVCFEDSVREGSSIPTAPMTRNPTPTACDILINSRLSAVDWSALIPYIPPTEEVRTLGTSIDELCSILNEISWDFHELLNLV